MAVSREQVLEALRTLTLPNGEDLVSRDLVRALTIDENTVRFVIEAESPEVARQMEGVRRAAEQIVSRLPGVASASVLLTAHGPAPAKGPAPSLKIGGHPKPQQGPMEVTGVDRILAVAWRSGCSSSL